MEVFKNAKLTDKADLKERGSKDKRKTKMDTVLLLHNDVEFEMHSKFNPPSGTVATSADTSKETTRNKNSQKTKHRPDDPVYEADEEDEDYNELNSHSPSPVPNPNRLLRSHFSVYEALQNPELNNFDIFDSNRVFNTTSNFLNNSNSVANMHHESTFLSTSSWQNISNSFLDLSDNSNGTPIHRNPSSVNSVLSLSDDNDDDHNHASSHDPMFRNLDELQRNSRSRQFVTKLLNHGPTDEHAAKFREKTRDRTMMNQRILRKLKVDGEFDEEYDSDESGTFDLKLNTTNPTVVTENIFPQKNSSAGDTTNNGISPSFVMPKMLVSFKDSDQSDRSAKTANICVLGNNSRIVKNQLIRVIDNPAFSLNYLFTKLNSEVDLIILIFDSESGLYFKEVLEYISSFGKLVLPVINTISKISNNIITNDGASFLGISSNNLSYNIEDEVVVKLLEMCNIKIFSSPIKAQIRESDASSLYDLNVLVSSYFNSKLEREVVSDSYDLSAEEYVNVSDSDYYCEGSRRFRNEEYFDQISGSDGEDKEEEEEEEAEEEEKREANSFDDGNEISIISDNNINRGRPELIQLSTSLWVSSLIKSTDESTYSEYNDVENIVSLRSSNQNYDRGKKRRHSTNSIQSKKFSKKKKKKQNDKENVSRTPLICFGFGLSIATAITILLYLKNNAQHTENIVPKINKINKNIWKSQNAVSMNPEVQDLFSQGFLIPISEGLTRISIRDRLDSFMNSIEDSLFQSRGFIHDSIIYVRQFVRSCAGFLLETFELFSTNF